MKEMKVKQAFMIEFPMTELDESCGMKLWYNRIEGGKGILRKEDVVKEAINKQIHSDLRAIARMEDIRAGAITEVVEDILRPLTPEDRKDKSKMELLYRRIGWFVAFALFKEPEIREKYETVPTDSEVILDREGLFIVTYPDRVLKAKDPEEVSYREYVLMPAGLTPKKWLQSWYYNMRLHVGMAAVAAEIHQQIDFGMVMGLSEGYTSVVDERLVHPYVWAYRNKKDEWAMCIRSDGGVWQPAPIWEFPGGIVKWVQACGKGIADSQFHFSPPVGLNKTMLDGWVARKLHREREIFSVQNACHDNQYLRGIYFERRTSQCQPMNREHCPYLKACWLPQIAAMPLSDGVFVPNTFQPTEVKIGAVV